MRPHDFKPAILRQLAKGPKTKAAIVKALGAQDRWDAIDYALRCLRVGQVIVYTGRVWRLTRRFAQ